MTNRFSLKNKLAIITGGCGLLGLEHAEALLENSCKVILFDNDSKKIKKFKKKFLKKNNLLIKNVNVLSRLQLKKNLKEIIKKFKKVDILINNVAFDYKPIIKKKKIETVFDFSLENWNKHIALGLTSAFICSQEIGKIMEKNKSGIILNIGSDLSVVSPDQNLYSHLNTIKPISYSVVKHGIVGMTKYLATYWAQKNIRVNCLSPGGVFNYQEKGFIKKIKKKIPLRRLAKKNEYKEAIQFLCSDASSYMTGSNVIIDGGRTII